MQGWIPACAESTPRIEKKYSGGNDGEEGEWQSLFVVLVDAGTHAMMQRWIPAYAGMTERKAGIVLGCASVPAHKVNTRAQVLKNSHILCERQFERFFGHRLRIEHFSLKGKPHKGPENDFSPLMR